MKKRHRRIYQGHVKYIYNDVVKPLESKFTSTLRASVRCTDHPSTLYHLRLRVYGLIHLIGPSTTNDLTNTLFESLLSKDQLHPCSMNCRINMRTIVPYPIKNGVTFCLPYSLNISGKGMSPRSKGLQPTIQRLLILTAGAMLRLP